MVKFKQKTEHFFSRSFEMRFYANQMRSSVLTNAPNKGPTENEFSPFEFDAFLLILLTFCC